MTEIYSSGTGLRCATCGYVNPTQQRNCGLCGGFQVAPESHPEEGAEPGAALPHTDPLPPAAAPPSGMMAISMDDSQGDLRSAAPPAAGRGAAPRSNSAPPATSGSIGLRMDDSAAPAAPSPMASPPQPAPVDPEAEPRPARAEEVTERNVYSTNYAHRGAGEGRAWDGKPISRVRQLLHAGAAFGMTFALHLILGFPTTLEPLPLLSRLAGALLFGLPLGWIVTATRSGMLRGGVFGMLSGGLFGLPLLFFAAALGDGAPAGYLLLSAVIAGLFPGALVGWLVEAER